MTRPSTTKKTPARARAAPRRAAKAARKSPTKVRAASIKAATPRTARTAAARPARTAKRGPARKASNPATRARPPIVAAHRLRGDRANLVRVATSPPSLPPLEVALQAPAVLAPEPAPAPGVAAPASPPRRFGLRRLVAVGLVAAALVFVAAQVSSQADPNAGTIKVHDGATAGPPQRNQPHVTGDFFVEGFGMAADSGRLFFFSWPPTGDGTLVMEGNWTADGGEPANHFLAGPFDLPCGHYRVGASNGPAEASDFPGGMKKKTFWVEGADCGSPACSPEGAPPCVACPTDLTAVANPDGSVTLSWTPAAGSDGTNIYRANGTDDFDYVTTVGPGIATYTDTTTVPGDGYTYTITGLFGNAESQPCGEVEVTAIPDFPTLPGLTLAASGGLAALILARRKA